MKRPLSPDEDCCTTLTHHQERLSYIPEHEALLAAFPAATAQAASDPLDGDEDGSAEVEEDEGQLRRWKAEQANKALWDFGGKIKRVQQDWRRLQEELRVATPNKRARTDPAPGIYSGPLLLVNQLYWEQNMGASISSITGDNIFGINMFGSYSSICAQMLRGSSSPAAAAAAAANSRAAPSNSSSNGQQQQGSTLTGPGRGCMTNAAVVKQQCSGGLAALARKNPHQQQDCHQQQQQQQWEEVVGETDDSSPHTPSSNNINRTNPLLPILPDAAAAAAPAAAPTAAAVQQQQPFDLEEIEAVCRAQGLSHLPASRRFVRALRIIKAAKQQQQQQQSVALEQQPALPLVAVV